MDGLVETLRDAIGDDLRVVAKYDRDGYDIVYSRDGLTGRVDDRAPDIHDELVLQGIGREHLEGLFDAGDLQCSMHRFDDLTAFHFVQNGYTGIFISIDSDASVDLVAFTEMVEAFLEPAA